MLRNFINIDDCSIYFNKLLPVKTQSAISIELLKRRYAEDTIFIFANGIMSVPCANLYLINEILSMWYLFFRNGWPNISLSTVGLLSMISILSVIYVIYEIYTKETLHLPLLSRSHHHLTYVSQNVNSNTNKILMH